MHEVRGVVARAKGEPVGIETVLVPGPRPGRGPRRDPGLRRLPHRPALPRGRHQRRLPVPPRPRGGRAWSRRSAPTSPTWRPATSWSSTGERCAASAAACRRGKPWYCFATYNATQKMTLADGTVLSARRSASARSPTRRSSPPASARRSTRPRRPTAAGLLGCGVMAGLGAAHQHRRRRPRRLGGRLRVRRSRRRGDRRGPAGRARRTIIAVDIDDRKLAWAKDFGATHTVNSAKEDAVEAIKAATGGNGADVCIEAIGLPQTYRQAFDARDLAGTVVLVGVPRPDMTIELPFIEVFGRGGALKSSWYGDCLPSRDFPMLIDLYLQGRLDLDRFVSETIARRGRGGVPQDGAGRGPALRRRPVEPVEHRPGEVRGASASALPDRPNIRSSRLGGIGNMEPVPELLVQSDFQPAGDQPKAIAALAEGVKRGDRFQTLLGITGSGKSATIAWTIEQVAAADAHPRPQQEPRRAARHRSCGSSSRDNRVEYFVSYYDYYQPEAYIAVERHLHREGLLDQRRDRPAAPLGHRRPAHPARRHRRRLGLVHLRHGRPRGVPGPAARAAHRGRLRPALDPAPARRPAVRPQRHDARRGASSGCGATPSRCTRPTTRRCCASRCSATRSSGSPSSTRSPASSSTS